jgi:hypothetical protein
MSLAFPHWLMIAGRGDGYIGVLVSGKKANRVDRPPGEPIDVPALPLVNSHDPQ